MADYDRERSELHLKVIYAGARGAGKSASLQTIARTASRHGKVVEPPEASQAAGLVEHVQLKLGRVFGRHTAFAHVLALPGGALAPTTRLLLRSADAVVFVVDASPGRDRDNAQALEALEAALRREGRDLWSLPLAFQWNKRDRVTGAVGPADKPRLCRGRPFVSTRADRGDGVVTVFQRVCLPALRRAGEAHGLVAGARAVASLPSARAEAAAAAEDPARPRVFGRLFERARAMFARPA
ncbi:MAG: hypothetical protein M9894_13755 [Planctomycetes bacterium]|nr:hypothetical protein [Planctomycetota bacterium]